MSTVIPTIGAFIIGGEFDDLATGRSRPDIPIPRAVQRDPADPYFLADVTLQNIVAGSSFLLVDGGDGVTVLAGPATAASTTEVVSNVPAYNSPQLIEVRVRKSSGGTKYLPLKAYGNHTKSGVSIWIAQQVDTIAS